MKARIALVLLAATALGACTTTDSGVKQTGGTLLGAVGGAIAGSQFGSGTGRLAATAAGTLLGAWLGSEVGKSLDAADRAQAERAHQRAQAAPIGERISLNNPSSGNSGSVIATREGTSASGAYCRELQQTITVGGKSEQAYGTACRQADGSWKVVQ